LIAPVSMMRGLDLPHVDGKASVYREATSQAATSILLHLYASTHNPNTMQTI